MQNTYIVKNLAQVCAIGDFYQKFDKLWEARPRLHQRQILQVNTRSKALAEIYKIYTRLHLLIPMIVIKKAWKALLASVLRTLLHRSAFKNSAKFRQTLSHFCDSTIFLILRILNFAYFLELCLIMIQNSPISMKKFRDFRNLYGNSEKIKISFFIL